MLNLSRMCTHKHTHTHTNTNNLDKSITKRNLLAIKDPCLITEHDAGQYAMIILHKPNHRQIRLHTSDAFLKSFLTKDSIKKAGIHKYFTHVDGRLDRPLHTDGRLHRLSHVDG